MDEKKLIAHLRRENERLRQLVVEAVDDLQSWAAYASGYFREKHDLEGNVADLLKRAKSKEPDDGDG